MAISGYTKIGADATFARKWRAATTYSAGDIVIAPDGKTIQRIASGTSGAAYDSTEQSAWVVLVGGVSASQLTMTGVKTANYSASANDLIPVDTTSGSVVITLPNAPADKTWVAVKHVIQGGTNVVTVNTAGVDTFNKVAGATTLSLSLLAQGVVLQYNTTTKVWLVLADDLALTPLSSYFDGRYVQPSQVAPLAQPGQTPSQLPVAPGTATVGSLAVAARADHIHPSFGLLAMWGVGGALTSTAVSPQTQSSARTSVTFDGTTAVAGFSLNSGTKTYTAQGGAQWVMSAVNITINATVTVINGLFPFFCSGTFTNNGILQADGGNASGFTGGSTPNGATFWLGTGANGGNGGTTNGSDAGGCVGGNGSTVSIAGNGGASGSNTGGNNTTANLIHSDVQAGLYNPWCLFNGLYYTNQANLIAFPGGGGGGGGAGDGTTKGGGGGAGGGVVIVNAKVFTGSGTISAKGGNGAAGTGGNASGGGAGGGGLVIVNTLDASGWTGTLTAAGGSPGAGSGTGATGGVQASFGAGWTQLNVWQ